MKFCSVLCRWDFLVSEIGNTYSLFFFQKRYGTSRYFQLDEMLAVAKSKQSCRRLLSWNFQTFGFCLIPWTSYQIYITNYFKNEDFSLILNAVSCLNYRTTLADSTANRTDFTHFVSTIKSSKRRRENTFPRRSVGYTSKPGLLTSHQ